MIRFFHHIRKSLMEQNKVRTYILYAIGEILLVVIGILIALQVNNWNEQRVLENSAQANLIVLKNNLNEDLEQLTGIHDTLEETLRSINSMMNRFQGHKAAGDSILYELIQVTFEYSFEPNDNGINILIGSGGLGVLSDSLQGQINRYYNTIEGIQERDQISNTFIKTQYEDYILEYYNFIFGRGNSHPALSYYENDTRNPVSYDAEEILGDKRLEALLMSRMFQTERQVSFYKQGIDDINRLFEMINRQGIGREN